jgi:hypothetical protein
MTPISHFSTTKPAPNYDQVGPFAAVTIEKAVLGYCICRITRDFAMDGLRLNHFWHTDNRALFDVIQRNRESNYLSLAQRFRNHSAMGRLGVSFREAVAYMASLMPPRIDDTAIGLLISHKQALASFSDKRARLSALKSELAALTAVPVSLKK